MSVAFSSEQSAETASETILPDRAISPHPNLVTEKGLQLLNAQLAEAKASYEVAQATVDIHERRRESARPLRDIRYYEARVHSAKLMPAPSSNDLVQFGSTVTFQRGDGVPQCYQIVGEDEADPRKGTLSFVSPLARALLGKALHDECRFADQEIEILAIR